jgi:hypothetical protein
VFSKYSKSWKIGWMRTEESSLGRFSSQKYVIWTVIKGWEEMFLFVSERLLNVRKVSLLCNVPGFGTEREVEKNVSVPYPYKKRSPGPSCFTFILRHNN